MQDPQATSTRADYASLSKIETRWNDYDMLRHVNNVQYYRYFEIAVLRLIDESGLDWFKDRIIPFAVESLCRYKRPLRVTDHIDAAIRIAKLGSSSVTYELALFMPSEDTPSAFGHWVHVFVDRQTEQPVPIPESVRAYFAQRMRGQSPQDDD